MNLHDGPSINIFDGLAVVAWLAATGLLLYDTFSHEGAGLGPFAPYGGLVALMAATLTAAGVARRAKEEILAQMDGAFELGRESVTRLNR